MPNTTAVQGVRISAIRILLVAPPMLAWGLERLIQSADAPMELQRSVDTLKAGFEALANARCDVLVAAVTGPDEFALLSERLPEHRTNVLLIAHDADSSTLDRAVLAGARGVVHANDSPATLLKAIEKVHEGELWIDRGATSRIFLQMARMKASERDPEKSKIATLTIRERQTVIALASDPSAPAKEIARRLSISEHTLRNHLTSIYSKLELCSRLDLQAYATRHRLVEPR